MRLALALSVVLATLCVGAAPARAAAREAAEAFGRGDFAGVMSACRADAEAGDPSCQNFVGILYAEGKGVPADPAEADRWFRRAADKGNGYAALNLGAALGLAYESGEGVRRNYRSAAKWYDAAAEHGDIGAASQLTSLYERGLGLDQDLEEAYFWYRVALGDVHDPSRRSDEKALHRVATQLSKDQIAAAEKAAREWHPEEVELAVPGRSRRAKRQASGPRLVATGSGFFVTRVGRLLTNNHVVRECAEVRVTEGEKATPTKLVAADPERDLALLQLPHPTGAAVFRASERLHPGESVIVVGFPLTGLLTSDPIVTTGIISALAGPRDDRHLLQISAPIQPGNSGGPLLDQSGRIIGVIVSSLSTLKLAKATGAISENINFAVNGDDAQVFLKAQGIQVEAAPPSEPLSTAAVADRALKVTVRLECWK
jgi:uncharacterized protein